jgi:hypothetical protein
VLQPLLQRHMVQYLRQQFCLRIKQEKFEVKHS